MGTDFQSERRASPGEQIFSPWEQIFSPWEQIFSPGEQIFSPRKLAIGRNDRLTEFQSPVLNYRFICIIINQLINKFISLVIMASTFSFLTKM